MRHTNSVRVSSLNDGAKWRDWAFKARSYFGKAVDPKLPAILKKVEVVTSEIADEDLDRPGMGAEWDVELRAFLNSVMEGDAFNTVRAGEALPAL